MEPPRRVVEIENTWIPLSDGSRLAARVWMPEGAERTPVPAVLEYLPYRKSDGTASADRRRHPYFASHGYAAIRVDLRGTGDSDGLLRGEYLPQEQDDALEVLAWLAAQPWCTGAVGMIGYSWGGFNGLQIAALRPPELKAIITIASTDDRYRDDCHYMGGCMLGSDMLKWASSMLTYTLQPPDPRHVGDDWREQWLYRLRNAPELAHDWVAHQLRDDFWKHGSVDEDYSAIECPVMAVGGWADAYTNAIPRLLAGLRVPRLGLIGPWAHMMPYEGIPGPAMDFLAEAVRWWDRWLKNIDTGIMRESLLRAWIQEYVTPATFHRLRPGRWVGEDSWPPAGAETVSMLLTGSGGLSGRGPDGALGAGDTQLGRGAVRARGSSEVTLLGAQECGETAGVWCANGFPDEIAGDQFPDDELSLCFETEPLAEPLEILGNPYVRLRIKVDQPLALVAARITDVAPDGASLLVSWGLLNLTHQADHETWVPLVRGGDYDVGLECRVCGHRFARGHRLRLALSPTYWPHAWPSPERVVLSVVIDGPSSLELPARRPAGSEIVVNVAPAPGPVEIIGRPDHRSRRIRVHPESRLHEITDREEHERIIRDSGVHYTETATDVFRIVEGDPLSANVHCERETKSEGPDVSWRVTLASDMTCDENAFHIEEEYSAYEADVLIYGRTRRHDIPRSGV